MRSIKLVPALAAMATTLVALAPAGASAIRQPGVRHAGALPSGGCRIRIEVPKSPIAAEEPVTIFGALKCPKPEEALGKQLSVYEQTAGKGGFALVGSPTTEPGGFYQFKPLPFSTNSVFYVLYAGAQSAHRTIRVSAAVSLATPPEGTPLFTGGGRLRRAHNVVTFSGSVSPKDKGALVALQREDSTGNEEWHRIGNLSTVKEDGTYSITHIFGLPGTADIRVVVHPPRGMNAAGASTPISYVISQPQNPLLTINAAPDPVTYGQATTISGAVAGASDKTPVTLLAHNRGGGHFVPVATGQTTGSAYTFPQTPLQNTLYQVRAAGHTSSTLVEGVKYGITATVSPPTAPAGQALLFSGTVTGALAGHVVYLERKNPGNIGFHVVDIGTLVGTGSASVTSFSILHAFYGAGEGEVRLKVPGDPGHLGKASEPTKITITPAPASALMPEAPGNSKLPGPGQI
jgi:hypothetical protein